MASSLVCLRLRCLLVSLNYMSLTTPFELLPIKRYVEGNAVLPAPSPFLGISGLLDAKPSWKMLLIWKFDRHVFRVSFGCCKTVIPD